jgi:hypothetical protein
MKQMGGAKLDAGHPARGVNIPRRNTSHTVTTAKAAGKASEPKDGNLHRVCAYSHLERMKSSHFPATYDD